HSADWSSRECTSRRTDYRIAQRSDETCPASAQDRASSHKWHRSCQTAPGQRSLRDRSCQLPRPISRSRPPDDRCLYLVEKWAKVICSDDDTRACLRGTATLGQGCFVLLLAPRFSGVSSSSGEGHMPSTANRRRFLKGMGAGA